MNLSRTLTSIIHILIFVLLISFYINNKNNKNNLIFILAATIVYVCYLIEFVKQPDIMNVNVENFSAPLEYKMNAYSKMKKEKYRMGPYSGLTVNNDGKYNLYNPKKEKEGKSEKCDWRKRPCNVALHTEMGFVTPTGIEQRYVEDKAHTQTMPYIDGKKGSRQSMFMFTHNQSHPDCCPSTYSTDKGCVCTTKQQRDFINKRGYNRSEYMHPGI